MSNGQIVRACESVGNLIFAERGCPQPQQDAIVQGGWRANGYAAAGDSRAPGFRTFHLSQLVKKSSLSSLKSQ